MSEKLILKTNLSKKIGLAEATGRQWIRFYNKFIPEIKREGKTYYNNESLRILKYIKVLSEKGISRKNIYKLFEEKGIPVDDYELTLTIDELGKEEFNEKKIELIPGNKELMLMFLSVINNGQIFSSQYIFNAIVTNFKLTDELINLTYLNNKDTVLGTRIRSVRYTLKKSGYIEEVNKFTYQITRLGMELLDESEQDIVEEIEDIKNIEDPFKIIEENILQVNSDLRDQIISHIKKVHWRKLEGLVVNLLMAMGYGEGQVTKSSNDEGIDGIIKEDKLGLDYIFIQAKRWENTVGREHVQSFSGALDGKGAKKGVFITTSNFSKGAYDYADKLESKKIILIDGNRLADLMISYNVGVSIKQEIIIKEINFDYFSSEEY